MSGCGNCDGKGWEYDDTDGGMMECTACDGTGFVEESEDA